MCGEEVHHCNGEFDNVNPCVTVVTRKSSSCQLMFNYKLNWCQSVQWDLVLYMRTVFNAHFSKNLLLLLLKCYFHQVEFCTILCLTLNTNTVRWADLKSKDFSSDFFFLIDWMFDLLKLLQEVFSSSALGQAATARKPCCTVRPVLAQ